MPDTNSHNNPSRWSFGRIFRGAPSDPDFSGSHPHDPHHPGAGHRAEQTVAQRSKQLLLEEISDFLLRHDLEVHPRNLTLCFAIFSGHNPPLASKVAQRQNSGMPVTQLWLDEAAGGQGIEPDRAAKLTPKSAQESETANRLLKELETGLQQFTQTTAQARTATHAYGQNLSQQSQQLSSLTFAEDTVLRLHELTNTMVEQARTLEAEMHEREQQAKQLTKRLIKVKREAETDPLTGLPNQRSFEQLFQHELELAHTESQPLCLAICQIDGFSDIVHKHGHDTADRVLKMVAKLLTSVEAENFHLARHGSEEFAFLFRGLCTQETKNRIDDMRDRISARRLINRDTNEPMGTISFSAGIADAASFSDTAQALRAADGALFKVRQSGHYGVQIA